MGVQSEARLTDNLCEILDASKKGNYVMVELQNGFTVAPYGTDTKYYAVTR